MLAKEAYQPRVPEVRISDAVAVATSVRDVPYALGADGDVEGLFNTGMGGCTRKHLYLATRLRNFGYRVAIGVAKFDWNELPIPEDIRELLKDPIQYHMFLFVGFKSPDTIVDVTWDRGMKQLGFPVYDWDGVNSTGLTVDNIGDPYAQNLTYLQLRSFVSETMNLFRHPGGEPTPFNDAFNAWIRSARS